MTNFDYISERIKAGKMNAEQMEEFIYNGTFEEFDCDCPDCRKKILGLRFVPLIKPCPLLRRVRYYTDTDEMYPDLLTPKGRKAVRKMKRFIKKHKITSKADINLIYGMAEIEKGKRK